MNVDALVVAQALDQPSADRSGGPEPAVIVPCESAKDATACADTGVESSFSSSSSSGSSGDAVTNLVAPFSTAQVTSHPGLPALQLDTLQDQPAEKNSPGPWRGQPMTGPPRTFGPLSENPGEHSAAESLPRLLLESLLNGVEVVIIVIDVCWLYSAHADLADALGVSNSGWVSGFDDIKIGDTGALLAETAINGGTNHIDAVAIRLHRNGGVVCMDRQGVKIVSASGESKANVGTTLAVDGEAASNSQENAPEKEQKLMALQAALVQMLSPRSSTTSVGIQLSPRMTELLSPALSPREHDMCNWMWAAATTPVTHIFEALQYATMGLCTSRQQPVEFGPTGAGVGMPPPPEVPLPDFSNQVAAETKVFEFEAAPMPASPANQVVSDSQLESSAATDQDMSTRQLHDGPARKRAVTVEFTDDDGFAAKEFVGVVSFPARRSSRCSNFSKDSRASRRGRTFRIGTTSCSSQKSMGFSTFQAEEQERLATHRKERSMGPGTRELVSKGIRRDKFCSLLGEKDIDSILQTMEFFEFKPKERVVEQGDVGKTFFVTHEGSLEVLMNDTVVNTMTPGHSFGGIALIYNCPRTASVAAISNASAWGANGDTFHKILADSATSHNDEHRRFLDSLKLFEGLPEKQQDRIAECFLTEVFEKGARVITEGEAAGALYFVKKGELSRVIGGMIAADGTIQGGTVVSRMGPGHSFGERALLYNEPWGSTVVTDSDCEVLCITGDQLKDVLGDDLSSCLERNYIIAALKKSPMISQLSATQRSAIVSAMSTHTFQPGEPIAPGLRFVVVVDGSVDGLSFGEDTTLTRGGWYEEDALMESADMDESPSQSPSRKLSTISLEANQGSLTELVAGVRGAKLSILTKEAITQVFSSLGICGNTDEAIDYAQKMKIAKKVHIFRQLAPEQLDRLVKSFVLHRYVKGAVVIKQGELGNSFFVIARGLVQISINGKPIRTLAKNSYIGERALLFDEPRSATVEVSSNQADLWFIDKTTFCDIVKGNMLEDLMGRIRLQDTNVEMKDLRHVKVVGVGMAGVVRLVEHKSTKTRYALKRVMKKEGKIPPEVEQECLLLKENDHPFIMCLVKTFETKKSVYMLTELITGGELHAAIRGIPTSLSLSQAQFYIGSLVLVLEELVERNIVYRDLKPENVMLDAQGYLKLIDFGAAKKLEEGQSKAFTAIGTPHYMAPEVMRGHGYSTEVDIWSLGVMLFELVCGYLPFGNDLDEPTEVCAAVLRDQLYFPVAYKNKQCKELMRGMMARSSKSRIGSGINGYEDIKNADFFKIGHPDSSLFNKILARELDAPLVPDGETYCDPDEIADVKLSDSEELCNLKGISKANLS